jgi:hypothetical protein
MDRKELVLRKLHSLTENEQITVIKQLTLHISSKLRVNSSFDRTKSGAHSAYNLGVDPVEYYVGETIKRLYDPGRWDWKFENFTLVQQLIRIANKILSDSVSSYLKNKEKTPSFKNKDISDLYDLNVGNPKDQIREETYQMIKNLAFKVSEDDEMLYFFTTLFFDKKDYHNISDQLEVNIEDVYALKKKLVRRLMKYKKVLIESINHE